MENYHQYEKSRWIDKPWLIYSGVIGITAKAPNSPTKQPRVCVCVCGVTPCIQGLFDFDELNCFSKKQGAEVPMSLPLSTKLSDMWQGYRHQGRLIYAPANGYVVP